jgi:hypothetical protein
MSARLQEAIVNGDRSRSCLEGLVAAGSVSHPPVYCPNGSCGSGDASATQSGSRLGSLWGWRLRRVVTLDWDGAALGWCEAGLERSLASGSEGLVSVGCVYAASSVGTRIGRRRSGSR